ASACSICTRRLRTQKSSGRSDTLDQARPFGLDPRMNQRVSLAFAGSSTGDFRPLPSPNDGKPIAEVEIANAEIGLRALAAVDDARKGPFGKLAAYQRA